MPVVTITNTDLIFITLNIDGVNSIIKKDWATTSVSGTNLILKWFNDVESRTYNYEQTIAWADVTSPVTANAAALKVVVDGYLTNASTPGGGYNTIEDEGTPLAQRNTANFVGAGVTVTDTGTETLITIPGGTVANASETVAGIVEEATQAEVDAGTDTGGTGARLFIVPSKAKVLIASYVTGLWDDRGNFDASVNAYPSSGGSGTAGAILKGDIWTVSVGGTLPTGLVVVAGDTVRALIDTPGNTQANWAIAENNIGYTPENVANKDIDGTLAANSDTKYASQKATKTYADTKAPIASPTFTGTPEAPTPTAGDNSTKVATTAFVRASSLLSAYSRTTATGTAIITEEVIASVLIPAGTLGNNDSIEIWALWGGTGLLATIKSMKIRLHTSVAVAGTTYGLVTTSVGSGSFAFNAMAKIYQKNATNIQEGTLGASASGGWGGAGAAVVTSALSNASDMYIVFTTTKAISTETINLNSFDVKINRAT